VVDAASVANLKDPDAWKADPQVSGWINFRSLFHPLGYVDSSFMSSPCRILNRHGGRANTAHVDGHAEAMRASKAGSTLPPGDAGNLTDPF